MHQALTIKYMFKPYLTVISHHQACDELQDWAFRAFGRLAMLFNKSSMIGIFYSWVCFIWSKVSGVKIMVGATGQVVPLCVLQLQWRSNWPPTLPKCNNMKRILLPQRSGAAFIAVKGICVKGSTCVARLYINVSRCGVITWWTKFGYVWPMSQRDLWWNAMFL